MKEIVIKIPDEAKQAFDNAENNELKCGFYDHGGVIGSAIRNGIVLPKGHGKLKDIGKCDRKLFYQQCGGADSLITVKTAFDMLLALPTIIEADKEYEVKAITRGKCMMCGKELTEGLFFCKECEAKGK